MNVQKREKQLFYPALYPDKKKLYFYADKNMRGFFYCPSIRISMKFFRR